MKVRESLDLSALRNEHSAICKAEHSALQSKALETKHANVHNLVGVVRYTSLTDWESQMEEHLRRK